MNAASTTERATPYISKSKFILGTQCRKLLWIANNAKHLIPEPDAQTQAIFDQGHEVSSLARKLLSDGIEIGQGVADLDEVLRLSQEAIKSRRPLFEPAFSHQGGYARADILNPVDADAWDIIEVKSSTSIKDVYILDLAFQAFVYAGVGLKIRRCFLLLINPDFIRQGDVDPAKFFSHHDVTAQVTAASRQIESRLEEMFSTIRQPDQPNVRIGPHCGDPYMCPLHDQCWSFLPEDHVLTLYRGKKKGFRLLDQGIRRIMDIPEDSPLTENQKIQRRVAMTGEPHVSKGAITEFLHLLKYPVSYLDFETFATAIPLFDGVRPYHQIPFQFSLHVVRSPELEPEHHSFLAEGNDDPRPEFMRRLQEALPAEGSVMAFNAAFELARLRECCALLPEFEPWCNDVERRIVDLLVPFRRFHVYHPKQNGSCSMKHVLPALTDNNYEHLEIQNGAVASLQFLRAMFGDVSEAERNRIRNDLDRYCCLDTLGMALIISALKGFLE